MQLFIFDNTLSIVNLTNTNGMTKMLSYHGDIEVKKKYVERFEAHRKADEVIQGTGFDNGRGCFVGCTLDRYDHSGFPVELGWPKWLALLADKIFEGVPKSEAAQFGSDLLAAVPIGVDLEIVRPMLAIKRIDRLLELQKNCDEYGLKNALLLVKEFHRAEILGASNEEMRSAARSAAWSAAESAESAAESAESAAESAESAARSAARSAGSAAESAARSAESAAESAESAAESAGSAAESAAESAGSAAESAESAESAAYQAERDDLISILRELSEKQI